MVSSKSVHNNLKLHLFVLSFFLLTLSIIFLSSNVNRQFHALHRLIETEMYERTPFTGWIRPQRRYPSSMYDFLLGQLQQHHQQLINIALINMPADEETDWQDLGATTTVHFDRVNNTWEDYFPDQINEDATAGEANSPRCPNLPMPDYKMYNHDFDLLVVGMPCGHVNSNGSGIRDVFRLQVNLVTANLIVHRKSPKSPLVVFVSSCGPMWEIFRCDDLLKHQDDYWVYRPHLSRLQQKVLMPVGICQLAAPPIKIGGGKITYDFLKLGNPIDHPREAFATVLHSSEAYICGAIVLAQSIIRTNTTKELVLLADKSITNKSRKALRAAGWKIKDIERIRCPHAKKGAYNEWNYSKLRLWQLTEYDKVMFIDSDLIVLKNIDNFFSYPQLSAAINADMMFNSGVMLIEPSQCTFDMLMEKRYTVRSYNGGDQGLLNEVFTWWHRWPTRLNYLKFFIQEEGHYKLPESLYAIHYLGIKPWRCSRHHDCNWNASKHRQYANDLTHWKWWQAYDKLPKELQGFCDGA